MVKKEIIENLINIGLNQKQIGDKLGYCNTTISNWLKKYNLKTQIGSGGSRNIKDLTGLRFNKLFVIKFYRMGNHGKEYLCRCDCGKEKVYRGSTLTSGKIKSCGCYLKEQTSKLGTEYSSYSKKYNWYYIKNGEKIKCRSGYEVLYANYLIQNNIDFEYEPECFKLRNGMRYTPDFYLKDINTYVEIKGSFNINKETLLQKEKIQIFKNNYKIKIYFWEDLVDLIRLPFKSYRTFFEKARKANIKIEDYLSDRQYICECGLNIDRDINASINIKNAGLNILKEKGINLLKNSTGLMPESYACGYMSVDVINSAQESSSFRGW